MFNNTVLSNGQGGLAGERSRSAGGRGSMVSAAQLMRGRQSQQPFLHAPPEVNLQGVNLAETLSALNRTLAGMARAESHRISLSDLPADMRKELAKVERLLEGRLDKLVRARKRMDELAAAHTQGKLVKPAQALLEHSLQVSKDELDCVVQFGYDPVSVHTALMKKQAAELHHFHKERLEFQIKVFTSLTDRDAFVRSARKTTSEFCMMCKIYNSDELREALAVVETWAIKAHANLVASFEYKLEKKRAYETQKIQVTAHAQADIEKLDTKGLLFKGLLEATNIVEARAKPSNVDKPHHDTKPVKPLIKLNHTSVLGAMAVQNPMIAKHHRLEVVHSHSTKAILQKRQSKPSRERSSSFHSARSASKSSGVSRSSKSSRNSRLSKQSNMSRQSLGSTPHFRRGRSTSRTSTPRSSRHSSRQSSGKGKGKGNGRKAKGKRKGKGKGKGKDNDKKKSSRVAFGGSLTKNY